jgi:hypothetical protein
MAPRVRRGGVFTRYLTVGAAALLAMAPPTPAQAQKESEILRLQQVIATIVEKDSGMQKWFDDAYGYVVFPNVGKGAMTKAGLMYEAAVGGQGFKYEPVAG